MAKLTAMLNIGSEMERKLNRIGIDSPEKLIEIGEKETYFQLKLIYPEVCLVHLYTLYGAIHNIPYNLLPKEVREDLKIYSDKLK